LNVFWLYQRKGFLSVIIFRLCVGIELVLKKVGNLLVGFNRIESNIKNFTMSPSLRQFMIISIIGMTILLVSLLYFHVELSEGYLKVHLDTQNKNLAIVLRNSLLAEGLETVLLKTKQELSDSEREQITKTLERELRWVPVVKVKVYSKDAMVLFSTKQDETGQSAINNKGVQISLAGTAVSGLVHRNHINDFDNHVEILSLHQQYIPIKNHLSGEVLGAFEIYTDVSLILNNLEGKQKIIFWSIGGILVTFYLSLAFSFFGTHRLLRKETLQRQKHLNELQSIHSELEQRVEQRTAELDKSKQFLQSVIDGIGSPLLVIRPDFSIALMNKAAVKLIPADQDIANYRYCYQVSHRQNKPCSGADHPCSFAQVMQDGCTVRVRHTHYDANNRPMLVDLVSTPLYSPTGEFEGVIEVEHDITQLVQMQAGLEQSEARLQAIMKNVPDAIVTCDSSYVIQSNNLAAQSLFNGKEEDLNGTKFTRFISDDNLKIFQPENMGRKLSMLKALDGKEFPADIWIGPLEFSDGVSSCIAVIRDITKRLQAQSELETTRQQYFHQEKMAAIGQLAAGILHEVGNPIAAIAGAASELKSINVCGRNPVGDCPFEESVSENINLIDEQTIRLAKITSEIADFASPKPRDRELLDLNGLLQSTARLLSYDQRFSAIEMDLQLDRNLPAIVGVADQLTQVFMNLLINAMDASAMVDGKKHTIQLKTQRDGDRVQISVKDRGQGMSKETLGHVLEPFYSTKPVGKGSGLGLSLCDTIVLAHGGVLNFDSELGKGTTVDVYLPIDLKESE
jgi:PAS domain S-box-containing protein